MKKFSLYVHFPYCLYKCHYCDFNSYAVKDVESLQDPYVKALLQELEKTQNIFFLKKIENIFLGGGTPSLFSPQTLEYLLDQIAGRIEIDSEAEITLELNPKTIHLEKIKAYQAVGVNRFSIGIQSFEDRFLAPLGRLHSAEEAKATLRLFEKGGVENFNFDLMFGFPGQRIDELQNDLETALQFGASHISLYNLTLEEGTIFSENYKQGKIKLPESDLLAEMYELGKSVLQSGGYQQYEISNYARPGFESKHNRVYWQYGDYLGLGAGAFSFLKQGFLRERACQLGEDSLYGLRWVNQKFPDLYIRKVMTGAVLEEFEKISFQTAQKEFWMMGLRLCEGVSLTEFKKRFGDESFQPYEKVVEDLMKKDWIESVGDRLRLSSKGQLLANEVVSSFFI